MLLLALDEGLRCLFNLYHSSTGEFFFIMTGELKKISYDVLQFSQLTLFVSNKTVEDLQFGQAKILFNFFYL